MAKKGLLLVNLGSPDSPAVQDVRKFLREFLMDERVFDSSYLARFALVHFLILPFRPRATAEAYRKIWLPEGSPLIIISKKIRDQLRTRVDLPIELAMRYQNPRIEDAIDALLQQSVNQIHLIPFFPHYAMSSYETAVERVRAVLQKKAPSVKLTVQSPYYDDPGYIRALAASARKDLDQGFDHLLFSFHGIPERHVKKSDPSGGHCFITHNCCFLDHPAHQYCYRAQCLKTAAAFVKETGIPQEKYSVSFQSRLGRDPWLKPYTDNELPRLVKEGARRITLISPAFVCDCLETLEELGIRERESFLQAGGEEFRLVPCLNDHPLWLDALENMVRDILKD